MDLLIVATAADRRSVVRPIGSRWLMTGGMTLVALQPLLLLAALGVHESYMTLVPGCFGGIGMASVMSPSNAAALSGVAGDRAGVGSAVVQTSRQVGGLVGIAVMGAIVAQGIAGRQTPEAFVHDPRTRSRSRR